MNRVKNALILTLLGLGIVLLAGYKSFIMDVNEAIYGELARSQKLASEAAVIREELAEAQKKAPPPAAERGPRSILDLGEEPGVMKTLFAQATEIGVSVDGFELTSSFFLKGPQTEFSTAAPATTSESLPQLDESGMPVGSAAAQDEEEWKGVEVLPMRFKIKGTFRSVGKFFHALSIILPLHAAHSLDLKMDGSGIVKGAVAFVFPARPAQTVQSGAAGNPGWQQQPMNGE